MVLRCAWGTCNSDERYPDRLQGAKLIPFPKPKRNLAKCLRWIKACGRPHDQLNVDRINKHKAVCTKHFVGGSGPSDEYPDPVQADGSATKPSRPKRVRGSPVKLKGKPKKLNFADIEKSEHDLSSHEVIQDFEQGSGTQTEEPWISAMDMLALSSELHEARSIIEVQKLKIRNLEDHITELNEENRILNEKVSDMSAFGVNSVVEREEKINGLFKHYTAITYTRFLALFMFLMPSGFSLNYEKGRNDIKKLSQKDCLFLVLIRLRHNFGLKDLAVRFNITVQSAGSVFNTWIDHMYLKLGQLSIWPHRDGIIENMPKDFRKDFPNTLVIIDGTEIKTQTPCALGIQSQLYSDYKSNTTLKALVGCDPCGSIIFISELFTGSISDKVITEQSGFYDLLASLKSHGYIIEGDAVMADKGFTIENELKKLGLALNIPPFSKSGSQMSTADNFKTHKISKHRVHIERLIAKIKTFQIVSNVVPTNLFQKINRIWTVCCCLTLFQDIFVSDKQTEGEM